MAFCYDTWQITLFLLLSFSSLSRLSIPFLFLWKEKWGYVIPLENDTNPILREFAFKFRIYSAKDWRPDLISSPCLLYRIIARKSCAIPSKIITRRTEIKLGAPFYPHDLEEGGEGGERDKGEGKPPETGKILFRARRLAWTINFHLRWIQ